MFSCLKGAEDGDGLILRCFNPKAAPASIEIGGDVTVSRTRLDESEMEGAPGVGGAGTVDLGPGEIATLRLRQRS